MDLRLDRFSWDVLRSPTFKAGVPFDLALFGAAFRTTDRVRTALSHQDPSCFRLRLTSLHLSHRYDFCGMIWIIWTAVLQLGTTCGWEILVIFQAWYAWMRPVAQEVSFCDIDSWWSDQQSSHPRYHQSFKFQVLHVRIWLLDMAKTQWSSLASQNLGKVKRQ